MSTALEAALDDLDHSTDALLTTERSDILALCSALERRADAITKIAFLVEDATEQDASALDRLAGVLSRGDQATRKVLRMKRDAIEEWMRLNQLLRGLATAPHHELDCSA
jgi:hypothetical protein